jgi:hypothetical protein
VKFTQVKKFNDSMDVGKAINRLCMFITDDIFGCWTYFQTSNKNRARLSSAGDGIKPDRVGRISPQYQSHRSATVGRELGLMELMRLSFWRVIRELRALEKEQNYNTKLQIDELEGVMNCEFNMTQNKIKLWDEELKKLMREKENNQYEK